MSLEADGFGRGDFCDDVGGEEEHQERNEERADVDEQEGEEVELHGNEVYVVGGGIERNDVGQRLGDDDGQGDDVAKEHALADEQGSLKEENLAYGPVLRPQSLEQANHGRAFKDEDEQSADDVKARHENHKRENDPDVHVKHVKPSEHLRVELFDGEGEQGTAIGLETVSHQGVDAVGSGLERIVLIQTDFKSAGLGRVPVVESAHLVQLTKDEFLVMFLEVGAIDVTDMELAPSDAVFVDEVSQVGVAHLQIHEIGEVLRNNAALWVGNGVTQVVNAFQNDALDVFVGFENARFGGKGIDGPDVVDVEE